MKHTSSIFLISLLLAAALLPAAAAGETLECIAPQGQYVNVRSRASSDASARGILHAGDLIDANPAEIQNGFFKTTYKDRDAYVSVKFFEIAVGADYTVSANGRVRMRKSPAGSASGFIQPGRRVHVIAWRYAGDGTKWARCAGGSYISADYLVPVM